MLPEIYVEITSLHLQRFTKHLIDSIILLPPSVFDVCVFEEDTAHIVLWIIVTVVFLAYFIRDPRS